jgi:hypothetical protein
MTGSVIRFLAMILLLSSGWIASGRTAHAEVSLHGEVQVRGFYTNNLSDSRSHGTDCPGLDRMPGTADDTCDDQDSFNDIRSRFKVKGGTGIASGVAVVDVFSREGTTPAKLSPSSAGTVETDYYRFGSDSTGGSVTTLVLREGYLQLTLPSFNLLAGRQPIRLGNGLILDDTTDGIVLAIPAGPVGITLGSLKLVESDDGIGANIDSDLYFLDTAWVASPAFTGKLFLLTVQDRGPSLTMAGPCERTTGTPPAYQRCPLSALGDGLLRLYTVGIVFDVQSEHWRFGAEGDGLKGALTSNNPTSLNPKGENLDLLGVNGLIRIESVWPEITAGLTGLYASGQGRGKLPTSETSRAKLNINAISPNFVLANILLNNEINSDREGGDIGGVAAVRLSVKRPVWGDLSGEVAAIWARLTRSPGDGGTLLGWEFDVNTVYPISENIVWKNEAGILMSGSAWKGLYGDPKADDNQIKGATKLVLTY